MFRNVALFWILLISTTAATDFYKLLGISRDATTKEIKKAYRQKSLEFHPDKNKAEGAAEKFAEIARAYEVLSDEDKKSIYDRHGEDGLKQHEERGGGGGGGGFDDFFSHFGFGRREDSGEQSTPSVEIPLSLTLEQLYLGTTIEVTYVRQVLCLQWEMCVKAAPECQGPGIRVKRQQLAPGFVQQVQQRDARCISRGKIWNADCRDCPNKTHAEKIELTLDIQPGTRKNERITFSGVADEAPGMTPGDLHFVVSEEPHERLHRDRDNLYSTMEIPLVDALTGFSTTLTHLDNHKFPLVVSDVTDCDHVMLVHGKGMPRRNGKGYGDLYITFEVDFPDELSDEQKRALREILGNGKDGNTSLGNKEEL